MPWKEQRVEAMREDFVKRVLAHEKSKRALCQEYGISRPTGDKWIERYLSGESMKDLSRAPKTILGKIDNSIEDCIIAYRKKYPAMGATKIHRMLQEDGIKNIPCPRTINNIFKRNGLITAEASQASTPHMRFEKEEPNQMWQADFLGHFAMNNGHRCHPLNVVDDCSRFNLCCAPLTGETFAEVRPHFERAFMEYGMPISILCDNGNPWGTAQSTGFTNFEVWLMDLGILTLHARVRHPQTQGKVERYNGTMSRELLKLVRIEDEADAVEKFSLFREEYNTRRPHHALGLDTPAMHYRPRNREYTGKMEEWVYGEGCKLHKVKETGFITLKGQGYFLSEAFGNRHVAIRQVKEGSPLFDIFYRQFKIARLDTEKRVYTSKVAYLIEGDPRSSQWLEKE